MSSTSIRGLRQRGAMDPQSKKIHNVVEKLKRNQQSDRSVNQSFASNIPSKKTTTESTSNSQESHLENAKSYINPEELRDLYFLPELTNMNGDELRIKLIISALGLNTPQSAARDRFGKITGIAKLGTVHTALQVGPVILEWDLSEIVTIVASNLYGNFKALAVIDIKTLDKEEFISKYLDEICKMIATWNAMYSYKQTTTNCQRFTQALLDIMGIKDPFEEGSKIKHFVDSISDLDKKDIEFSFTFNGEKYPTVFKSHQELDIKCFEKYGSERELQGQDHVLLKAFDRVYWLRYYDALADEILSPERREILVAKFRCGPSCFFHDPSTTPTSYANMETEDDQSNIHPSI
eukprot:TRINITY_DN8100_c0_g1_i1.p1 TRINITY_DN8100_c0_g1~~TRINITY_DN8100_c0_g1_i1.p1  ORF type:complete len:350 (+),score=65.10 TRINITY_DN8100_c0_g1_i1:76-1125(+)